MVQVTDQGIDIRMSHLMTGKPTIVTGDRANAMVTTSLTILVTNRSNNMSNDQILNMVSYLSNMMSSPMTSSEMNYRIGMMVNLPVGDEVGDRLSMVAGVSTTRPSITEVGSRRASCLGNGFGVEFGCDRGRGSLANPKFPAQTTSRRH
jgi:hypothetical protein